MRSHLARSLVSVRRTLQRVLREVYGHSVYVIIFGWIQTSPIASLHYFVGRGFRSPDQEIPDTVLLHCVPREIIYFLRRCLKSIMVLGCPMNCEMLLKWWGCEDFEGFRYGLYQGLTQAVVRTDHGRTVLKWTLCEQERTAWAGLIWLSMKTNDGLVQTAMKTSDAIKCAEFLAHQSKDYLINKYCFVELLSYSGIQHPTDIPA
jgi:hypothetical protein